MSLVLLRLGSIVAAVIVVVAGAAGFADVSLGAAIVGETRQAPIDARPAASIDAMKAEYGRPAYIPFPAEDRFTPAKASLGKKLFFDTRLSASSTQSCASCHNPGFGWGDGLAVGVGHGLKKLTRRSPTIVNSAFAAILMWDGRAATLEEQVLGPIQAADEMNMPVDRLMPRLAGIDGYNSLFAASFPGRGMTPATLAEALATYERTIVSDRSPFDDWIEGDEQAIPEAAKRGFAIFNGKGRCSLCHEGWNFTNDGFHDIGVAGADVGRAALLPGIVRMRHAFKTPGLRDIANRGPYMHDGSIATLDAVIDHYDGGGVDRPSRSALIGPLGLRTQEKSDLVAFLNTLTGKPVSITMPLLPR